MAETDWRTALTAKVCRMDAKRYLRWGQRSDLDQALSGFARLSESQPGRADLAALLVEVIIGSGLLPGEPYLGRADALVAIVEAGPGPRPPDWARQAASVRILVLFLAGSRPLEPGFSPGAAGLELDGYRRQFTGVDEGLTLMAEAGQLLMRLTGENLDSDATSRRLFLADARGLLQRLRARPVREDEPSAQLLRAMTTIVDSVTHMADLGDALGRGDLTRANVAREALQNAAGQLPEGLHDRGIFGELLGSIPADFTLTGDAASESAIDPGVGVAAGLMSQAEAAGLQAEESLNRTRPDNPASLDRAVRDAQHAVDLAEAAGSEDWELLEMAGLAYLLRGQVRADDPGRAGRAGRADLDRSIALFERTIAAASTQPRIDWPRLTQPLAHAYRLTDRDAEARTTVLRGLRGGAWTALLQNDVADAQIMATDAARNAVAAARLVIGMDDAAGAVAALEAGRGLIVFSARQAAGFRTRLVERGRTDLAEEWDRAVRAHGIADVPANLRLRVVGALAGVRVNPDGSVAGSALDAGGRLLDPPDVPQIQSALREIGQDALVYLVAGDRELTGFAVVVPARGAPSCVQLPELESDGPQAFEGFVAGLSRAARGADSVSTPGVPAVDLSPISRDLAPKAAALDDPLSQPSDTLGGFCDWAWRVAIGPLLHHLDRPHDRPVRLVLVPMQEMALVPWHAARHELDGMTLYALHHAVFSYAASARMVCEAAARPAMPLSGAGLVIGDPATGAPEHDLPSARLEATSVRQAFYPAARYLGRLPGGATAGDGAGTPGQVTDWLANPEDGAVLHLACHGEVRLGTDRGDSSYLILDGGARLSAEELAEAASAMPQGSSASPGSPAARPSVAGTGHRIGLAVLAACSTAKSGRGYDEAFNLGTVLLSLGVRSVVSAQWPVPDTETSVLMFMLHHFVRVEGLPPADALRAAQLWMLGDRKPPTSMPDSMRNRLGADTPDIVSWAGFVHSGR